MAPTEYSHPTLSKKIAYCRYHLVTARGSLTKPPSRYFLGFNGERESPDEALGIVKISCIYLITFEIK